MASLKYGIQKDMIQMNLLTKLKVIHRLRERTYGCRQEGWEKAQLESVGWTCTHLLFSCQVVSDSLRPHGLQPARLFCPWDFPGKKTGAGCHFLLQHIHTAIFKMNNQQGLTVQHMELCSMLHGSLDGRGVRREMDTCMYVWLSSLAVHLKPSNTVCQSALPQYRTKFLKGSVVERRPMQNKERDLEFQTDGS